METPKLTSKRIKEYLLKSKRFDGRKPGEFRETTVETGISKNAEGSSRVKIGETEVLVGIKMDIMEPYPDSPDKGNLITSAELLPLSSPRFESGPPKFPAIELARVTDRFIRESKFIDFKKLCIKKGEKVWAVFIDIYSINDDGNLLDAAGIGALAALKTAKIPKYDKKEEKVLYGEWSEKKIPLSKEMPVSITIHKIGEALIVDPTREEEDTAEANITIGSHKGSISSIQKSKLESFKLEEIEKALDLSEKVWEKIFEKIKNI